MSEPADKPVVLVIDDAPDNIRLLNDLLHRIDGAELRRRAEEQLGADRGPAYQSLIVAVEPLKLLHELQVYQIELELQNAELRQARDEVASLLEEYTDLYDFAPVGYLTLDRSGTIHRVNLSGGGLWSGRKS